MGNLRFRNSGVSSTGGNTDSGGTDWDDISPIADAIGTSPSIPFNKSRGTPQLPRGHTNSRPNTNTHQTICPKREFHSFLPSIRKVKNNGPAPKRTWPPSLLTNADF